MGYVWELFIELTSNELILAKTIKTAMEKEIQGKYLKNSTFLTGMSIFFNFYEHFYVFLIVNS